MLPVRSTRAPGETSRFGGALPYGLWLTVMVHAIV
jgi:hypothetical protein